MSPTGGAIIAIPADVQITKEIIKLCAAFALVIRTFKIFGSFMQVSP
jgi:hypothetical protein